MKKIILTLGLLAVMATQAMATSTTKTAQPFTTPAGAGTRGIWFSLPAMSSGDTAVCVFNNTPYIQWVGNSGAATTNLAWGYDPAGGDSMTVGIHGCVKQGGTYVAIYANTLQANTVTLTAPMVAKSVAATTFFPFPFTKVQLIAKATIASGTPFFVLFEQTR